MTSKAATLLQPSPGYEGWTLHSYGDGAPATAGRKHTPRMWNSTNAAAVRQLVDRLTDRGRG